jgi:hypothetical protein
LSENPCPPTPPLHSFMILTIDVRWAKCAW